MINHSKNYSITEAASALGVDRTSVNRWVKADKIKYGRHFVNGRVFIKGIELIRIMNS